MQIPSSVGSSFRKYYNYNGTELEELPTGTESAFGKKVIKVLHERIVHMGKTVTDLQILGYIIIYKPILHQSAFGSRGLCPDPLGDRAIASVSYTHLTLPTIYSV